MAELAIAMAVVGAVGTLASTSSQASAQRQAGEMQSQALTVQGQQAELAGQYQRSAALAQQQAAEYEAGTMETRAGQERAVSQRAAAEQRRQARLLQSRLQARAAAGGGGATDETVVNLDAGIEAEGEYRALTDLWTGEQRARNFETGAGLKRYEGREYARAGEYAAWAGGQENRFAQWQAGNARRTGKTQAANTLLAGGSSVLSSAGGMFAKYGGSSKPKSSYQFDQSLYGEDF